MTERPTTFEKDVLEPVHIDALDAEVETWVFRRPPRIPSDAPPRLLLLHGLGDAPVTWFPCLRDAFPGHELLLPALPGAGRGPLPEGHDHVTNLGTTQWYAAVVDRLTGPGQRTQLIGHSLGGWITMRAYVQHPDAMAHAGVPILISTAGTWYDGVERERDLLTTRRIEDVDELLDHIYATPPNLPPVALQALLDTMGSPSYRGLLWSTTKRDFMIDKTLAKLPSGTGIVWGRRDRLVPQAALEVLRTHVPEARVVELDDCGHAPHLERPDALRTALGELMGAPHTPQG